MIRMEREDQDIDNYEFIYTSAKSLYISRPQVQKELFDGCTYPDGLLVLLNVLVYDQLLALLYTTLKSRLTLIPKLRVHSVLDDVFIS